MPSEYSPTQCTDEIIEIPRKFVPVGSARGPFGLSIERDLYFTPGRLSAVMKKDGQS